MSKIRVLFVCLGNICRSPMAEFVFKHMVKERGVEDQFYIDSAATSRENEIVGAGIYCDTKVILKEMHIPFTEHISRQMRKEDYDRFDFILGMEEKNIHHILGIIGEDPKHKVHRLLDYTDKPRNINDPWYYGNFDSTYYDIEYGCEAFLNYLLKNNILIAGEENESK